MPMPMRSGSGMLGNYFKENRNDSNGATAPTTMTVDLTEGKCYTLLLS